MLKKIAVKVGFPNDKNSKQQIEKEISICDLFKSKSLSCIPQSLGHGSFSNGNPYIIRQHIDYSLLEYQTANNIPGKLTFEQIFVQMIYAVEELHNLGFVHADIKPEIFRIKNNRVFIIDLEHARKYIE